MNEKRQDGGPAFPTLKSDYALPLEGMSLRDYYAGKFAAGFVARYGDSYTWDMDELVERSVEYADALIAVLQIKQTNHRKP